jgi:hypothetical protein
MVGREGDAQGIVLAPDEARTMALNLEQEDPTTAANLREVAQFVEESVRAGVGLKPSPGVELVAPRITGPAALRDWTQRYPQHFQAAYRVVGGNGCVVLVTPATESLDDPPTEFRHTTDDIASALLVQWNMNPIPSASPGHFYVIASCRAGRFQGTFLGMLPIPGRTAILPDVRVNLVPV